MLTLGNIIIYLFEGLAITVAIYLIAKKRLQMAELLTLALTISVTFMILDLFSPSIGVGARQGTGFGLGLKQFGGDAFPAVYSSVSPEGGISHVPTHYAPMDTFSGCGPCAGGRCPMPAKSTKPAPVVEGMDDPVAIEYYQRWNPPYQQNNLPPPLNTEAIYTGSDAPRTLDYDGSAQPPIETQLVSEQTQEAFQDPPIRAKLRKNPFDTQVRTITDIEKQGAVYDKGHIPELYPETYPVPTIYSPLKPDYGYRYQLPRGWDDLEQENLSKAFNGFRNTVTESNECQVGPYGQNGQDNANYHYQKKNVQD